MSPHTQKGFTIVELLIVIVIIGILAAITIVAYNGIQNRARISAAQSLLSQTNKKVLAYQASEGSYPADLNTAGVTNTTDLQYSVNNTASPASYCLTAANGSVSYFMGSTQSSAQSGGCAGHGQGGALAITNMAVNPSMASVSNVSSAGAPGTNAVIATGGFSGNSFVRRTFSGAGTAGLYFNPVTTITPGTTYTASVYVRSSIAASIRMNIEWKTSSSTLGSSGGSFASTGPSGWTRVSSTGVAPATADRVTLTAYASGTPWVAGDYQDMDAGMLVEGSSLPSYADGDSSNWVWNGTPNSSTSTGPAS